MLLLVAEYYAESQLARGNDAAQQSSISWINARREQAKAGPAAPAIKGADLTPYIR
jgi:hypothetical protein